MAKPDAVFIYIGTYPSEAAARDDYAVVKDLHPAGAAGTYDAAVVTSNNFCKGDRNVLDHWRKYPLLCTHRHSWRYDDQEGPLGNVYHRLLLAILLAHRCDNSLAKGRLLNRQRGVAPRITRGRQSPSK